MYNTGCSICGQAVLTQGHLGALGLLDASGLDFIGQNISIVTYTAWHACPTGHIVDSQGIAGLRGRPATVSECHVCRAGDRTGRQRDTFRGIFRLGNISFNTVTL